MSRSVILVVIDCLRADHVSAMGYQRATTPALDRMAEEGVLWEQAHSTSSWTKPSVTSMLTGQYPSQHGSFEGIKRSKGRLTVTTDRLTSDEPTLAERFAAAGWRCGAFMNNAQLGQFSGLNRGFDCYVPDAGKADPLIARFLKWLQADLERPAFAYLHLLEAHWPYKPRRRHVEMFGGDRDRNFFRDFSARDFGRLRRAVSHGETMLAPQRLHEMIQMYDGAIRRLDGKIAAMRRTLDELGALDDAALFVTADHGEEFLEHGGIGQVVRYRDRYGARAGAYVRNGQDIPRVAFGELEDPLHEQLSLLSGYQNIGIDNEIQAEELSVACNVSKGRAGHSLRDQI